MEQEAQREVRLDELVAAARAALVPDSVLTRAEAAFRMHEPPEDDRRAFNEVLRVAGYVARWTGDGYIRYPKAVRSWT